eukprot:sb/3471780/
MGRRKMTKTGAGAHHQQQPHHNGGNHGDSGNHGNAGNHHGGKRRGTYWGLINEAVAKKSIKIDTKTRQLLISALATLILVWVFCLCYLCWWGLSFDFLFTYLFQSGQNNNATEPSSYFMDTIGLDHTGYMNLIVVSYVMILLSATTNPIIHLAAVRKLRVTLGGKQKPAKPKSVVASN